MVPSSAFSPWETPYPTANSPQNKVQEFLSLSRVRCSAILEAAMGDSKREPRQTKIICTLGPSTETPERLKSLIDAGMDIARLNFSHGTHAGHGRAIRLLRRLARERDRPVAILQDLQGPKIRTGLLKEEGPVYLRRGAPLVITTRPIKGNAERIATTFAPLPREVKRGDSILISDGLIELRVEKVSGAGGDVPHHQWRRAGRTSGNQLAGHTP